MSLRSGAQQPHINKGTIDETLIIIQSEDILQKYYKLADQIFSGIMTHSFETKELINLRDWLLPMLMNGQVTVK
jgi:type I restriction enzyme S subunit